MATDGRNIGSEIFKSLAQGLSSYAGAREAEQTKREQNAVQLFMAELQQQEANRKAQEGAMRMAGLQLENRSRDIQLKELLDKQRDPVAYQKRKAEEAAAIREAELAAEARAQQAQMQQAFGVQNTSELLSGLQSGSLSMPAGSQVTLGPLKLSGPAYPDAPDPLLGLKREALQADIGATNALAAQRGAPPAATEPSVTEKRFDIQRRQAAAMSRANDIYTQSVDPKERAKIGISAIASINDLQAVLKHLDKTGGRTKTRGGWADMLVPDDKDTTLATTLRGLLKTVQVGGYGPDGSFPTEEDYQAAKAMGIAE